MTADDLIVAATFFTEPEAHIARTRIESAGYFAAVFKDDLGGIYPNFQATQGVRLMVRKQDLEKIMALLEEEVEPDIEEEGH
jgi:hypothetical protein